MSDNAAYFYNKINEDLRRGRVDVKAEDIIDIIDGFKGGGYGVSTQHELGGYTLVGLAKWFFKQTAILLMDTKRV